MSQMSRCGSTTGRVSPPGAVNDVVAPVLRPGGFVVPWVSRLFLVQANRFHPVRRNPQEPEPLPHRISTTLAEGEVVLASTTLVAIAFDAHRANRVIHQVATMGFNDRDVGVVDHGAVVFEIHTSMRQYSVGVDQRIDRRGCGGP